MATLEAKAWFVRRDVEKDELQPFTKDGVINSLHTEAKIIRLEPVCIGSIVDNGAINGDGGFSATASLQSYFCNFPLDDDDVLRQRLSAFWESPNGLALLQARFGQDAMRNAKVFPTHVTRRNAPPDHLSLVHIDYPPSFSVRDLYREWQSRWKNILPSNICETRLLGVLTVWIALNKVTNFPLCVAVAKQKDTVVYKAKRHSVGVYFGDDMSWYTCPNMKKFDAWIFDTQHSPHCAIDLLNGGGSRVSVEVRCLVVKYHKQA